MNVYDNIIFLVKHNNIPIGEFEREMGVSTGYFSRARKGSFAISAELLYTASRYFGITMDALYTGSFMAEYIQDEIRKLEEKLKETKRPRGIEKKFNFCKEVRQRYDEDRLAELIEEDRYADFLESQNRNRNLDEEEDNREAERIECNRMKNE